MLSGLGNPEACFLSGNKAFFIEHRGYNDLWCAAKGGHDAGAYLYVILHYRDNGGAAADDTTKGHMRRVAGGGSTTSSRLLSNEGCLPLREKAAHVLMAYIRIKFHMNLQADKSPVVGKGPFFPRVVNPRYRIRGTMCNARIQTSKARKAILEEPNCI
jgi:hypothetical protein